MKQIGRLLFQPIFAFLILLLFGVKKDFIPMPEDNLLINYGQRIESFDFAAHTARSEQYFSAIDQLEAVVIAADQLVPYQEGNPYEVPQSGLLPWISVPLLLGLPALLLRGGVWWVFRLIHSKV